MREMFANIPIISFITTALLENLHTLRSLFVEYFFVLFQSRVELQLVDDLCWHEMNFSSHFLVKNTLVFPAQQVVRLEIFSMKMIRPQNQLKLPKHTTATLMKI